MNKYFYGQMLMAGLAVLGVAGLGVCIFSGAYMDRMPALYVFAALGIAGFLGNASFALARYLREKSGRP